MSEKHEDRAQAQEALFLLRRIDTRLDHIEHKVDAMPRVAARYGASAGAAAGGVVGGLVSAGIAMARAKLGL